MVQRVLRVVPTHASAIEPLAPPAPHKSAAEQVFDHWVFMFGRNPRRCAFGPGRRKAVERALGLYDLETLMLAIEGCAASAWHAGDNDRNRPFDDLELILRDEPHIERFAADGERLRERADAAAREADTAADQLAAEPVDPAQLAAQRERLRRLADTLAGRARL